MKLIKSVTAIAAAAILTTIGVGAHSVGAANIEDTKAALSDKQSAGSDLQAQLQTAQSAVAKLNGQAEAKAEAIKKAQADIKDATAKIAVYDKKITVAQATVTKRTTNLKAQLRSLQKQAGDSVTGNVYFDFVLNAKSLDDVVSRSFTVGKLSQANSEALNDVQTAAKNLADLKQAAVDNKASLQTNEAKLKKDQDQLKTLSVQASQKSAALQKKISENQAAVDALQGDITKANADAKAAATKAASEAKTTTKTTSTIASATKTASVSQASSASTSASSKGSSHVATGSLSGIAGVAAQYIGVPYVWGGSSPSGFDCSGLVSYAAAKVGVSLPRTAAAMSAMGSSVSLGSLQSGDLVFWGGVGSAYHVGIYIGGGRYIHAPQPGQSVTIQSISAWSPSFARRL